jgi:hypothetical protein
LFYLLIAVGGVTFQDLFLEHPIKLPFLGVDLPLLGFFSLGLSARLLHFQVKFSMTCSSH